MNLKMKILFSFVICFAVRSCAALGVDEQSKEFWNENAKTLLEERSKITLPKALVARNIIIFVGAGMSQSTVTAARKLKGGENGTFSFEQFPWSGLARTYCIDKTVPDDACSATAFLTGVKSNFGTVGVAPNVQRGTCGAIAEGDKLESIAKWALKAGKAIGFATTSRVTSGSAPSLYAHSSDKSWESNQDAINSNCLSGSSDIASQLINGEIGKEFKVVLGGGRKNFLPTTVNDESGLPGLRTDNVNLIELWKASKGDGNATFITTKQELQSLDTSTIDYLFGLFDYDQLPYHLDVVNKSLDQIPPLISMVHYSLEMLQKPEHKNGFLLFVEDGLINEAHKENKINKALAQIVQYSNALGMAEMMNSASNTLILSMSNFGSTLSIAGSADRSTSTAPIQEAGVSDVDNKPYLSLSYAAGPAFNNFYMNDGSSNSARHNPMERLALMEDPNELMCSASLPMSAQAEAVNGGEDVTVYATGPWSHLFSGNFEQNFIAHAIGYAACLEEYCNGSSAVVPSIIALLFVVSVKIFV